MNSRLLHVGAAASYSAVSLLLSSPAFPAAASAATDSDAERPQLKEVVVTATKRAEREVTVPISLSVLGGA
ncbi:MAG: hypothetical protein WAM52_00985, partial [Steroidobacteraceae bacterium]